MRSGTDLCALTISSEWIRNVPFRNLKVLNSYRDGQSVSQPEREPESADKRAASPAQRCTGHPCAKRAVHGLNELQGKPSRTAGPRSSFFCCAPANIKLNSHLSESDRCGFQLNICSWSYSGPPQPISLVTCALPWTQGWCKEPGQVSEHVQMQVCFCKYSCQESKSEVKSV